MKKPKAKTRRIRRWCLWHPKDGLLTWTMSLKPRSRRELEARCSHMLSGGSVIRTVWVTMEFKEPKP